jgi:hypothetical protein
MKLVASQNASTRGSTNALDAWVRNGRASRSVRKSIKGPTSSRQLTRRRNDDRFSLNLFN